MQNRWIAIAARVLLGIVFLLPAVLNVVGAMPQPQLQPPAAAFAKALADTHYMMPLMWGTMIIAGILLLSGLAVPLALVLLAPLVINIFAFHLFLDSSGTTIAILIAVLELHLAWYYRGAFSALFRQIAPPAR